jgi:uncharacterized protein
MRNAKQPSRLAATRRGALGLFFACALPALLILAAGCKHAPAPAAPSPSGAADPPQHLPTTTLLIGRRSLVVEVASTDAQRRKGMMFRRTLGPDEAMLFVFARPANLGFWMKNTSVDLDLAYIAADGRIAQIGTMKAYDLTEILTREPALYALEAPAGWFAAHGVAVGEQVTVPPEVAASGEPE